MKPCPGPATTTVVKRLPAVKRSKSQAKQVSMMIVGVLRLVRYAVNGPGEKRTSVILIHDGMEDVSSQAAHVYATKTSGADISHRFLLSDLCHSSVGRSGADVPQCGLRALVGFGHTRLTESTIARIMSGAISIRVLPATRYTRNMSGPPRFRSTKNERGYAACSPLDRRIQYLEGITASFRLAAAGCCRA